MGQAIQRWAYEVNRGLDRAEEYYGLDREEVLALARAYSARTAVTLTHAIHLVTVHLAWTEGGW